MVKQLVAGFFLALLLRPVFAQEKVEVITLRYHRAEQLIPALLPLVAPNGAISAMQNHLVVRADAAQHAQIRRVLDQIDVAPRRLQITVRQNTTLAALTREAGVYGRIGDERGRVTIADRSLDDGARIEARNGRSRLGINLADRTRSESSADTQTLQVLEGTPAFIRIGQSVPFSGRNVYVRPYGATIVEETRFIDVVSGFHVLPRVSGERVTLEIMPQRNSLGMNGAINVQQAATTASAPLGEWIELGGINRSQLASSGGTFDSRHANESQGSSIFVRVDELK